MEGASLPWGREDLGQVSTCLLRPESLSTPLIVCHQRQPGHGHPGSHAALHQLTHTPCVAHGRAVWGKAREVRVWHSGRPRVPLTRGPGPSRCLAPAVPDLAPAFLGPGRGQFPQLRPLTPSTHTGHPGTSRVQSLASHGFECTHVAGPASLVPLRGWGCPTHNLHRVVSQPGGGKQAMEGLSQESLPVENRAWGQSHSPCAGRGQDRAHSADTLWIPVGLGCPTRTSGARV